LIDYFGERAFNRYEKVFEADAVEYSKIRSVGEFRSRFEIGENGFEKIENLVGANDGSLFRHAHRQGYVHVMMQKKSQEQSKVYIVRKYVKVTEWQGCRLEKRRTFAQAARGLKRKYKLNLC